MPQPHQAFLAALLALLGADGSRSDAPWRDRLAGMLDERGPNRPDRPRSVPGLCVDLRRPWLLLPDLIEDLGTDDDQRAVLRHWCEVGVLLANGGAHDVPRVVDLGSATADFVVELWRLADASPLTPATSAAIRAQVLRALDYPAVFGMSATTKQRTWELCVGLRGFFVGFRNAAVDDEALLDVRLAARAALSGLLGANGDDLALGPHGLSRRPSTLRAAAGRPGGAPADDGAQRSDRATDGD